MRDVYQRNRRRLLITAALVAVAVAAVEFCTRVPLPEQVVEGRELFTHEWTAGDPLAGDGDGLGPVFNANSCRACHFQGGVGGSGTNQHNVTAFNVLPNQRDPVFVSGVVHASATSDDLQESTTLLQARYPIVRGLTVTRGGCTYREPDVNPLHFETLNTPALFGSGIIDIISDAAIKRNVNWRRMGIATDEVLRGDFEQTPAGRVRILDDGRVGRFGWKAQFATLEEFVAAACAVEVGLTNPYRSQDVPRQHASDTDAELDMTRRQFYSLVAFCRHLPAPRQTLPPSRRTRNEIDRGERLFAEIGCVDCHTSNLGGVPGIYSDFALHRVDNPANSDYDDPQLPLPHGMPDPDEWKTPPLWGVADSAPYWHDGSAPTLESAVTRHHGQAERVAERFRKKLSPSDQQAIIAFLKTLRAPSTHANGRVAAR